MYTHIPKHIKELSIESAERFNRIMKTPQPQRFEVGQIWSTYQTLQIPDGRVFQTDEPRLVVVLREPETSSDNAILNTAIIALDAHMASEFDLVIKGEDSPLGFDFMIEIWNEAPVFQGHLKRFLAKLSDAMIEILMDLYRIYISDMEVTTQLKRWVGFRIFEENDPRLAFQEHEVEVASYLANASTAILSLEESQAKETEFTKSFWTRSIERAFKIKPVFENLHQHLGKSSEPKLAFASDIEESNTWIVHNESKDTGFTFELLCNRRRSPNQVYLYVHYISEKISGSKSIITIFTPEFEIRSDPTVIKENTKIIVGEVPYFKYDLVECVEVEIEEECTENG